ncbi:hypothetical protein ACVWYG_000586 [Pedobacter sp. UYEF25]
MFRQKNFILPIICIVTIVIASCHLQKKTAKENDWQTLFNGKNLDGWIPKFYHHPTGENYANTFKVVDGVIQVNYDGYKEFNQQYGHLFYKEPYSSYHLKFEYQFTDQWMKDAPSYTYRNSGVMFHSQDPKTILKEQDWPISIEYQILAEERIGEARPTGNMCSPGTDVYFKNEKDPRHCINSRSKTYKWDDWVSGELIVYKDSLIKHIVNGDTVLQYTKPQIGGGIAIGYDPAIKVDGKPLTSGFIALQAEGQGINFRNIKIKMLD